MSRAAHSGFLFLGWLNRGLRLAAISTLGIFVLACAADANAQDESTRSYEETVERLNLQDDIEILAEDDDWRTLLDVPEPGEPRARGTAPDIDFVRITIWMLAALIVGFIIFLIIRYGAAIQVGVRSEAGRDEIAADGIVQGLQVAAGQNVSSLDDVLAIKDNNQALGALLRLVLETALGRMEMSLKRSETARAVLRRLPRDWEHFGPVASLVRLAERVRYAGDPIDRQGLEAAVEEVRPVVRSGGRA